MAQRLTRPQGQGTIAGVCAGLANYFGVDVTLVRLLWVVLSVVPGAIVGGVLAYLLAWLIIPEGPPTAAPAGRRLVRSGADRRIAGVCGGLAEYFGVDSTPVRLLWVILSIWPGCFVGGVIAYIAAWLIIPSPQSGVITAEPKTADGAA